MRLNADALGIDLAAIAPEGILAIVAVAVILLDLVVRNKALLAWIAAGGIVLAALAAMSLWLGNVGPAESFSNVFQVDKFSLFFKLLILGVTFLVVLASPDYVARFHRFQGEYYGLVLLAAVGMMLITSTGELISIYIALELQTFALVALTTFLKDEKSTESGLKFLVVSAVGTAILLYGMALLFGLTGTTFLKEIAPKVAGSIGDGVGPEDLALVLAAVLLLAGFGFKIASVPFQMWVPDVYEGAPTPIVAYLSVASKAAGFAVLLRVFYSVFGQVGLDGLNWQVLIGILAVLSMTVGNVVAIAQNNLKRLLAYSTIAHAGYILAGVAALSQPGNAEDTKRVFDLAASGILFYLVAYAVTNIGVFVAIIAIANRVGSERIEDFAGMATQAPFLAFALALCLVSLTGLPPTAGFMGKVYIFYAAVESGLWWLALAGVINSFISAYYYLKPIRSLFVSAPKVTGKTPASWALRASLAVSIVGVLWLGVLPQQMIRIATTAAGALGP